MRILTGLSALSVVGAASVTSWLNLGSHERDVRVLGVTLAKATAATPPTPTITSGPSGPTASTTATFTYTDSQAGVSFLCSLDASTFASCPASGRTYSGLAAGSHTFRVVAEASGATSKTATRTWSVDVTGPTAAVAFPTAGAHNDAGWTNGCKTTGICGTAGDATDVQSVAIAVQQLSSGRYLVVGDFTETAQVFNAASGTTSWKYGLTLPAPDGDYLLLVRATDTLGNTTTSTPLAFSIDTVAPAKPTITAAPDDPTTATSASFQFTGDAGASFSCQLDNGSFAACSSGITYDSLKTRTHAFAVRAVDQAGNAGIIATHSWEVVAGMDFDITGAPVGPLAPGIEQPIDLRFANPYNFAIVIDQVSVSLVPQTSTSCSATENLRVSRQFTGTITVPANGVVTMSDTGAAGQRPAVTMLNLPTNQDECKNTTFSFTFAGIASKA